MGARVLNRFELCDRLGSGGFGTVYRAWDERLQRDVAVKAIELGGQPLERVLREAQAVARLNHPGVVTLYELGEEGQRAYLVSELVDGSSLAELQRSGELSDREVGVAALELCAALAHAHARGVVHRDIKPQNVQLAAADGGVKLMDFGIARVLGEAGITASGDVLGTLSYISPEQAEGQPAAPAADVYSLALTLYEAWSGQNPVARATPAATARAIGTPVPPLASMRRDLPANLCEAVDACLTSDPELRLPLDELAAAVTDALPSLDAAGSVPRPRHRRGGLATALDLTATRGPAGIAAAAAVGGMVGAAMLATPASGPSWAYLLPVVAALLTLPWPRAGYVLGAAGLTGWLAAAQRPGAALLVAILSLPMGLLLRRPAALPLPAASPLLGLAGAAPVYPALAGLAGSARDRLLLGAGGYAWLAVAEVALDRKLLFGPSLAEPAGWQRSASTTVRELLLPLLGDPVFWFGLALWSAGAFALGMVVRGRNPVLDLLGALLWAAALVTALRLHAGAAAPAPGLLAGAVLAVLVAAIAWRARLAPQPPTGPVGAASPHLSGSGSPQTLP